MIILHGIYDNGKIKIKEKKLPKIKAEVEIIITNINKHAETEIEKRFPSMKLINLNTTDFHFDREEANEE